MVLAGGMRLSTQALLGVKTEFCDALARHGHPEFALHQGLNEQGQKVQREQSLDSGLVLEEHRRDFVHGLDLLETFLDHRLAFVGPARLGRA